MADPIQTVSINETKGKVATVRRVLFNMESLLEERNLTDEERRATVTDIRVMLDKLMSVYTELGDLKIRLSQM